MAWYDNPDWINQYSKMYDQHMENIRAWYDEERRRKIDAECDKIIDEMDEVYPDQESLYKQENPSDVQTTPDVFLRKKTVKTVKQDTNGGYIETIEEYVY